eukprot:TRINITY_DN4860_c0_g1_i6.p1 TRINITY_DN4860_c0_g1~~TRINITY_DN4860_c0_g1_i6.p1  ORF type:complete len:593 (-),score=155.46 TRINITY_DN4860_c0_g1_i6:326-2104(-)
MAVKDYDPDELPSEHAVALIVSTYQGGTAPPGSEAFGTWLADMAYDERVCQATHLANIKYAVFGVGDVAYEEDFCKFAIDVDGWLHRLSAQQLISLATADPTSGQMDTDFEQWRKQLFFAIQPHQEEKPVQQPVVVQVEEEVEEEPRPVPYYEAQEEDPDVLLTRDWVAESLKQDDEEGYSSDEAAAPPAVEIGDLEDIAGALGAKGEEEQQAKEMLTKPLRTALTKQGYKLVGSHSAVKLCRWTKSMLRGRGGCYKHTFYGINSHQCMEATPSLACANKCVFCWRHHKNPVGREWRWATDPADVIVDGAIESHTKMIKEFRGVPGVKLDRFEEGMRPRHCALSLVGEPIAYPHINQLAKILHAKQISSFLVTNAQYPDKIKELVPVTQLYVSIDAATKDTLQEIDRPLFKDFWERFLASLDELSRKGQRTVYRLTLVKKMNMDEIRDYVGLVQRGQPDFIEVKGVTYCGTSNSGDKSGLTMDSVPWHEEVVEFTQLLCGQLEGSYEVASEHAHSCCVLIANTKFKKAGEWYTWIDYDRFHELSRQDVQFTSLDYMDKTPDWACFGHPSGGFAPYETRHRRKGAQAPEQGGC